MINYSSARALTSELKRWEAPPCQRAAGLGDGSWSAQTCRRSKGKASQNSHPIQGAPPGPFHPSENWFLLNSSEGPGGLAVCIKNENPSCLRAVQAVNTKEKNDLLSVSRWIHYLEGLRVVLHQNIIISVIRGGRGWGGGWGIQRKLCGAPSATG